MEDRNSLQAAFLAAMGDIQEVCVQTSLCQAREVPLEERFYDLAGEVILRVMEVLDGYGGPEIGRLCIVCPETGSSLKEAPMIELHDAVCDYLRGMEQRTKTGPRLSLNGGAIKRRKPEHAAVPDRARRNRRALSYIQLCPTERDTFIYS